MQFSKYFVHKIGGKNFALITDAGNWLNVSAKELESISENSCSKRLLERLERKKIILTAKNKRALSKDYAARFAHLQQGISLHIINPTMRCNQFCQCCYADSRPMQSSGSDMGVETARKTVDFIWQSPGKSIIIEFQGGEPLANFPAIGSMIDYASRNRPRKRIHWRMVSNFSLMDETIASYLKKHKVLDLCTSLDGPKKIHDRNRPLHCGSYRKVVYWLDALRNGFRVGKIGAPCTVGN